MKVQFNVSDVAAEQLVRGRVEGVEILVQWCSYVMVRCSQAL
jgi:hypothetical protein